MIKEPINEQLTNIRLLFFLVFQSDFGRLTNKGVDEGWLAFPGQIRESCKAIAELHHAEEPRLPTQERSC